MNKRHLLLALSISICVAMDVNGGGVREEPSGVRAREALMRYYNVPNESRKVEISGNGRAVTVCTDDCERFEVGVRAGLGDLWDAIVLFKAFLSKTMLDDTFRDKNATLAKDLLGQRSLGKCDSAKPQDRIASCVLTAMAKTSQLRMTRVVYDEGNKCESEWSFDQPQKLLNKRCSKVTPRVGR